MATPAWKIIPEPSEDSVQEISLAECRKYFAVDDSGSTSGAVLKRERDFVFSLQEPGLSNPADQISLWGFDCDTPTTNFQNVNWSSNHGGTCPTGILVREASLKAVLESDAFFLLTDGEVPDYEVYRLSDLVHENNLTSVPIVFVIVGHKHETPEKTNISVGISQFAAARETLILFKDTSTSKLYVIAGKGAFACLVGSRDLTSWDGIPVYNTERALWKRCQELGVKVPLAETRSKLPTGIDLGEEWEAANGRPTWVEVDLLPKAGILADDDLFALLADEAFNNLSIAYKTRRRIPELRTLLQAQKVEIVTPKLQDVHGAAAVIEEMNDPTIDAEKRQDLQQKLREAHKKNREHYQNEIESFGTSPEAQLAKKRNQMVNFALSSLATTEAAGFNAQILSRKSNRARRAEAVLDDNAIRAVDLDLEGPAYRGYCSICCGDDEIMSICLKELPDDNREDNTTDFALNFPLAAGSSPKNVDLVSSQNVCFQCAMLGLDGHSIYHEKLNAIVPAVQYDGANKTYINQQLYTALTARLATGAAGIAQLFMAILDEVLKTKAWAGTDQDRETAQRRNTFRWMLDQFVQNTVTRETFNELGGWVKYPQALAWVARDFETNGLASFAVTYPIAGFEKLISLSKWTDSLPNELIRRLRIAKSVYSVASMFLADMQKAAKEGRLRAPEWRDKYLKAIYREFNWVLIPKDLGQESIITELDVFAARLKTDLGMSQVMWEDEEDGKLLMPKIQVILFWLVFRQTAHCTAQTFFKGVSEKQHFSSAVLDPTLSVPETEHRSILLSIFATESGAELMHPESVALHLGHVPFGSPFGPPVLRCGAKACGKSFHEGDLGDLDMGTLRKVREARARHLELFGIRGRFENSQTGLPAPVARGEPPSSVHMNMHANIVRTWARHTPDERRSIVGSSEARKVFVGKVIESICEQKRGNVFNGAIVQHVADVLPSFFDVLGQALRMQGKSDEDVGIYDHDPKMNNTKSRIEWELSAAKQTGL